MYIISLTVNPGAAMSRSKHDPKVDALREHGCLHPHPEKVTDEAFVTNAFFDPRDLVQVKYEMLRRVRVDGQAVSHSAASFGLSRPSYYQAQAAYDGGAEMIVTPCPVCQMNVEVYQGQINKTYGTQFKMPVVYYSTLMSVAYGKGAKQAALGGHVIPAKKLEEIAAK